MNNFIIIIIAALVVHFIIKSIEITIGFITVALIFNNIFKKDKKIKIDKLYKINDFIYKLDNFLNEEECTNIINNSKDNMVNSELTRFIPDFRTSKTSYDVPEFVEHKLNDFLGLDDHKAEACQVHHYKVGEQFKEHYDWFDDPETRGQRTWSIMIYLNDVDSGGETHFPKLNLNLVPKRGTLVLWNNLNEDTTVNYELLHSGKPVISGDKWILTKWLRL